MSHSTTATSTYVIAKYSRFYPNNPGLQTSEQAGADRTSAEWQHFTNPVIRLVLDVKKARNGELESMRLRILWQMGCGLDDHAKQAEEDLELMSFSDLSTRIPQKHQSQGLPLKAVYRDTVVGIRYLLSRDVVTMPVYRRFQISFLNASAATEFIHAIRTVCPCKANPANPMNDNASVLNASMLPPAAAVCPNVNAAVTVSNSILPDRGPAFPYTPSPKLPTATSMTPSHLPASLIQTATHMSQYSSPSFTLPSSRTDKTSRPLSSPPLNPDTSSSRSTWSGLPSSHLNEYPRQSLPHQPSNSTADLFSVEISRMHHQTHFPSGQSFLPDSSPSMPSTATGGAPKSSNTHQTDSVTQQIYDLVPAMQETSKIYDLPVETLECIIGDVIREDGFVNLLEKLGTLWRVKTLIGQ
ncbi:hypothetical protein BDQ12DRAFT_717503 [Crucibulum laeve]|uniref:Uncharacterized protein n=1 Tax=Crucibulum laeve TaxID=68775 RepID=A0A5C3MG34_9AGAR|nr:hypothetical protein BDQ12DRAFT_717503 [Crucibulum laeve]